MKVGILGLGLIGSAWAKNLQEDGVAVSVWNRTPKNIPGFMPQAIDVVRQVDVVIVVVSDPAAVEQVLDQVESALHAGQILVQCSTISAAWTLAFAQRVQKTGAVFLEAPFTGSKPHAEVRKTVFYVGGEESWVEQARPVLERLGSLLHIGPLGRASSLGAVILEYWTVGTAEQAEMARTPTSARILMFSP